MDDLMALQALPEVQELGLGPQQFLIDLDDSCTVCTSTCGSSPCSVSAHTNL